MRAIVSDTHALIWYLTRSAELSADARKAFRQTESAGDSIYVPSIVIVELRYLVERQRVSEEDYLTVLSSVKNPKSALLIAPLDLEVAEVLSQIPHHLAPDMPDRIIAATALSFGAPLVTSDSRLNELTNVKVVW